MRLKDRSQFGSDYVEAKDKAREAMAKELEDLLAHKEEFIEKYKKATTRINQQIKNLAKNTVKTGNDYLTGQHSLAYRAIDNWANSDFYDMFGVNTSRFFNMSNKGGINHFEFRNDKAFIDSLSDNELLRLSGMLYGNTAKDWPHRLVGMQFAQTLTMRGQKKRATDAAIQFAKNYGMYATRYDITEERVGKVWEMYRKALNESKLVAGWGTKDTDAKLYDMIMNGIKGVSDTSDMSILDMSYDKMDEWLDRELKLRHIRNEVIKYDDSDTGIRGDYKASPV